MPRLIAAYERLEKPGTLVGKEILYVDERDRGKGKFEKGMLFATPDNYYFIGRDCRGCPISDACVGEIWLSGCDRRFDDTAVWSIHSFEPVEKTLEQQDWKVFCALNISIVSNHVPGHLIMCHFMVKSKLDEPCTKHMSIAVFKEVR